MPSESLIFPKVAHFKDTGEFSAHLSSIGVDLPLDSKPLSAAEGSPMAQPIMLRDAAGQFNIGNRWCIQPMEGWDGTPTGEPTEHTLRRWSHFGLSGAKLIWGGEAFAVQDDGRANPRQLAVVDDNCDRAEAGLRQLLNRLADAHQRRFGKIDDLLVGLQLTHSGRFCRPNDKKLEPKIAYHHPILDRKFGIAAEDDSVILSDDYIDRLIANYIRAARLAQRAGFRFVDVKLCHGYLGHELLSAFSRPGKFGGDLANRTRFAREIIEGIQNACPGLAIGVRFCAFDQPPFAPDPSRARSGHFGAGAPEDFSGLLPYIYSFGCNHDNPLEMDLREPIEFVRMLGGMGVKLINVTGGSPYYNPHIQRPAAFPPSDGYQPPEDPLVGVARQMSAVRQIKAACPQALFVGSSLTYLQEYLPHVAQAAVREGWMDFAGVGRLVLAYWEMPADTLEGKPFQAKRLCRTFSDCTTAPRNGLHSGCYPLDAYYKESPEHLDLKRNKADLRRKLAVMHQAAAQ